MDRLTGDYEINDWGEVPCDHFELRSGNEDAGGDDTHAACLAEPLLDETADSLVFAPTQDQLAGAQSDSRKLGFVKKCRPTDQPMRTLQEAEEDAKPIVFLRHKWGPESDCGTRVCQTKQIDLQKSQTSACGLTRQAAGDIPCFVSA